MRRPALLLLAPLLALLPLLWRLADHAATVLAYPWQIDYDEGIILRAAWMLAQGQNPYHPPRPDAFTSATYPPLYYLLNAIVLRQTSPSLLSGRLIALTATLIVAGLLGWWAWRESRSRLTGLLAAGLWLSLSPVYVWSTFYKPDLPAIALTVAGLLAARRWSRWPGLLIATLLFSLAFFTKQSALVGPLAVGLWLLAGRGQWLRFGLATGGLIGLVVVAGNLITRGGLWLHIVVFQQIPWTVGQLEHNLSKLTTTYPWLLATAGLGLVWLLVGRTDQAAARWRWPFGLPVWYLVAALPATLVANGRIGVNFGLLLDLCPPLCLVAAIAVGELLATTGRRRLALGATLTGLLTLQAIIPNPPSAWYSANRMPSAERASRMRSIASIVEQTPGRILSEDLLLLLRANKPIEYDDPFLMAQSALRDIWDERRFIADLEAQRFALVLLEYEITDVGRSPRWTPAALAALRANYEILHRDALFVHRPRSLLRGPGTRQEIVFGNQLRLTETAVSTTATRPGGTLRVMLRWSRASQATADYVLFVHLVDASGGLRGQIDVPPSAKPTRAWTANERAEAEYALTLPDDAPLGTYRVVVGVYDPATGQRLAATRAGAAVGDAVPIGELKVDADPSTNLRPTSQRPAQSDTILEVGATLARSTAPPVSDQLSVAAQPPRPAVTGPARP